MEKRKGGSRFRAFLPQKATRINRSETRASSFYPLFVMSSSAAGHSPSSSAPPAEESASSCSPPASSVGVTAGVVKGAPSQYVKLNVGGCLYYTTVGTLTKHDNMLRAMFSGRMEVLTDAEGGKQKKSYAA